MLGRGGGGRFTLMWKLEDNLRYHLLKDHPLKQNLSRAWSLSVRLEWVASKPSCLHFPVLRLQVCVIMSSLFKRVLGNKPMSSYVKHHSFHTLLFFSPHAVLLMSRVPKMFTWAQNLSDILGLYLLVWPPFDLYYVMTLKLLYQKRPHFLSPLDAQRYQVFSTD